MLVVNGLCVLMGYVCSLGFLHVISFISRTSGSQLPIKVPKPQQVLNKAFFVDAYHNNVDNI